MKIGVILAHFQPLGKQPDVIDRLNNFVRLGAIKVAVDCSMVADMLSGPVDLDVFSESRRSVIWFSVQRRSDGQLLDSIGSGLLNGSQERLKQLWKKSLSNCAFP